MDDNNHNCQMSEKQRSVNMWDFKVGEKLRSSSSSTSRFCLNTEKNIFPIIDRLQIPL